MEGEKVIYYEGIVMVMLSISTYALHVIAITIAYEGLNYTQSPSGCQANI
jgi:hypothetical protein